MRSFLDRLGSAVLLAPDELMDLIRSAPHRYKVYQIEKKEPGQFRTIAQPAREVKALQYWILKHVLNQFDVHPAATAYREGTSILDNARPHVRGRYLLKLDFRDFFPSIKAHDLRLFLKAQKVRISPAEITALCRVLFWIPKGTADLCLSIGAPTSPALSNILMMEFDRRVAEVCAAQGVAYTRYADDLSFSAARSTQLQLVEARVLELCSSLQSPSLTINQRKTVRVSRREARRVTGLVLTNDRKVSLGREQKRRLRACVHHFVTGRLPNEEIARLKGMLAYVNAVENSFIRRLRKSYGDDVIARILKGGVG